MDLIKLYSGHFASWTFLFLFVSAKADTIDAKKWFKSNLLAGALAGTLTFMIHWGFFK